MDFVRRRLSQGGSSDDEGKSLSSSFSEGTSRFFSSMVAKKNGLLNNISSKIENVMKVSSSEDSSSGPDTPDDTRVSSISQDYYSSQGNTRENSSNEYRPRRKTTERIGRPQYGSSSSYSDSSGSEERVITPSMVGNISFDEPLYSPTSKNSDSIKFSKEAESTEAEICPQSEHITGDDQNTQHQSGSTESNAMESEDMHDQVQSNTPTLNSKNNVEKCNDPQGKDVNSGETNVVRRAPKLTSTNRRSSTVDEMLFDDYVPPTEENDDESRDEVSQDINFNNNKKKTLIPMGDLMSFDDDQESDTKASSAMKKVEANASKISPFQSISSIDSSEYSAYNLQTSVDSSDSEFGGFQLQRTCSFGSENSWSSSYSVDSQPDDLTLECMEFMKQFVDKVFDAGYNISQTEKAKFGELCQEMPGRQWFSRYVNSQRVHNKRVNEQIFFRLVQYFAVVLFECNEAEDYSPAKSLMNMCFTFYHQNCHGKNFLYSFLREQPIWQSLRFWNAAFFDAVQSERSKRPVCTRNDKNETLTDDQRFQENITFGQLGTFTCNMRAFGLSKELCLEFLRKQSTIANLKKEQVQMLKDNVDKWKDL